MKRLFFLVLLISLFACKKEAPLGYYPKAGEPRFVIPASNLPNEIECLASNNNVGIEIFEGRLFVAWRSSETHFASANSKMFVISSPDMGKTWEYETTIALGSDAREPNFLKFNNKLFLYCFKAGTNPVAFEPIDMMVTERLAKGSWTTPEPNGETQTVPWQLKVHNGLAYMTCYRGSHYSTSSSSSVDVFFKYSTDGRTWQNVNNKEYVYRGGVSEVGYEWDKDGNLWAVTRNEDGDDSGFGSHLTFAPASDLSAWQFPAKSSPYRYDSPKMFKHGNDIYLVARRNVDGPYDKGMDWLPISARRVEYLATYSATVKRTALYKINTENKSVDWLFDLPGTGDNAFPSVVQTGEHSFVIANYTSPLSHTDWNWIQGQVSSEGTQIYLIDINFEPTF